MNMSCYLRTQCVDNARIAENHQWQRQKVCDENDNRWIGLGHSDTAVDAEWNADSVDDVRSQTSRENLKSWDNNPDRDQNRNMHVLLGLLLQTALYNSGCWRASQRLSRPFLCCWLDLARKIQWSDNFRCLK